jgi:hypothetical protein
MRRQFLSAAVLALVVSGVKADEPKNDKKPISESEWQQFLDSLNPFTAIQKAREAAARQAAMSNLKQLAIAAQKYQVQGQPLPSPAAGPYQQNSWMWQLLPYLEQNNTYDNTLTFGVPANRLGASIDAVSEAMQTQLDLPKNRGVIVTDVAKDSAAAKAGLQKYDIVIKWDGKDVAGNPAEFANVLSTAPAKKAFNIVVLRKGKEIAIKDVTLPESAPNQGIKTYLCPSDGTSNTIMVGEKLWQYGQNAVMADGSVRWLGGDWTGDNVQSKLLTTTHRQDDRFTTRYQEGSLIITLTGTIKDNKAAVSQVKVIDGSKEYRYESIDKTPEEYRDKARDLVKSAESNRNPIKP